MPDRALPAIRLRHSKDGADPAGVWQKDKLAELQLPSDELDILRAASGGDTVHAMTSRAAGAHQVRLVQSGRQLLADEVGGSQVAAVAGRSTRSALSDNGGAAVATTKLFQAESGERDVPSRASMRLSQSTERRRTRKWTDR